MDGFGGVGSSSGNAGGPDQSGMTGAERMDSGSLFDNAMSAAAKGKDDKSFDTAQANERNSHPANEFGSPDEPEGNALSGADSFNSHRGYGQDGSQPRGRDVQSRLDELNRQIAERKANEDPHALVYDTRDTPNANSFENPTGLDSVPKATSVVYSGDTNRLVVSDAGNTNYDFAADASAVAAEVGGLSAILESSLADHLTPDAARTLKSASRLSMAAGPAVETLEAALNAGPGERVRSGAEGLVSSIDDVVVGVGVTVAFGGATGAGLGAGAALTYDNSAADQAFDSGVRAAGDMVDEGIEKTKKGIHDFQSGLIDQALSGVKRRAANR